jgi:short-subunit dehydrogenase
MTRRAVVVGASSGIGMELARQLAAEGYELGLVARRKGLLDKLASELPTRCWVHPLDISASDEAIAGLSTLLRDMESVDLVVLNAGIGFLNRKLKWEHEKATILTNVEGFAACAGVAWAHFVERGGGHLVGISSVAALRGGNQAPAYAASKAFVANYLEGLAGISHQRKLGIAVTDIRPGFVDTPMTKGQKGMFWVAEPHVAVRQIVRAIRCRRRVAYVTRRWGIIAALMRILPHWIYRKL